VVRVQHFHQVLVERDRGVVGEGGFRAFEPLAGDRRVAFEESRRAGHDARDTRQTVRFVRCEPRGAFATMVGRRRQVNEFGEFRCGDLQHPAQSQQGAERQPLLDPPHHARGAACAHTEYRQRRRVDGLGDRAWYGKDPIE